MLSDERVEKVARAMAVAVHGYDEHAPRLGAGLQKMSGGEPSNWRDPIWKTFVGDAKRFLGGYDAINN